MPSGSVCCLQLFRERLSENLCTRQSRKVIWDMINTLFLTTAAVEPTVTVRRGTSKRSHEKIGDCEESNMHRSFGKKVSSSFLIVCYYTMQERWRRLFFPKLRVHIKDNNNSPHGKFHRFLFPFSSKFPDLNFAPYVPYIYSCYETHTWHKQGAWITCVGACRKIKIHSPLPSSKNPHFQNEAKCTTLFCENQFNLRERKNNLVLIQRPGDLQKKINHWSALFQKLAVCAM